MDLTDVRGERRPPPVDQGLDDRPPAGRPGCGPDSEQVGDQRRQFGAGAGGQGGPDPIFQFGQREAAVADGGAEDVDCPPANSSSAAISAATRLAMNVTEPSRFQRPRWILATRARIGLDATITCLHATGRS